MVKNILASCGALRNPLTIHLLVNNLLTNSDAASQQNSQDYQDFQNESSAENNHGIGFNQRKESANKTYVVEDHVNEVTHKNNDNATDSTFVVSNSDRESNSGKHPLLKVCNCKNEYCSDVTEECRKTIHHEFWRLDYDRRKQWIYSHVKTYEPARRYVEHPTNNKKRTTRRYWLPVQSTQVRVCPVSSVQQVFPSSC